MGFISWLRKKLHIGNASQAKMPGQEQLQESESFEANPPYILGNPLIAAIRDFDFDKIQKILHEKFSGENIWDLIQPNPLVGIHSSLIEIYAKEALFVFEPFVYCSKGLRKAALTIKSFLIIMNHIHQQKDPRLNEIVDQLLDEKVFLEKNRTGLIFKLISQEQNVGFFRGSIKFIIPRHDKSSFFVYEINEEEKMGSIVTIKRVLKEDLYILDKKLLQLFMNIETMIKFYKSDQKVFSEGGFDFSLEDDSDSLLGDSCDPILESGYNSLVRVLAIETEA